MTSPHIKFYLTLFLILFVMGGLVTYEAIRAGELSTTTAKTPLVSTETYAVPLTGLEPTLGNPGAQNTIILFADLGSRESRTVFTTLKNFVNQHPQQFKLLWKDAPEPTLFTQSSLRAHVGAGCAGAQNKFWPFTEEVFTSRNNLNNEQLTKLAEKNSLDMARWSACFSTTSTEQAIQTAVSEYRAAGITKIPGLFINGKKISLVKEIKLEDILQSLISP